MGEQWRGKEGRRTIRQNGGEGRRRGEGCSNSNELELPTCNCERSKTGFIVACVQLQENNGGEKKGRRNKAKVGKWIVCTEGLQYVC